MFRRLSRQKTKSISKWAIFSLFFSCFVFVIGFGFNIVLAVWHEPTAVPAGDNIFGFLHIGPDNQAKKGKLRLGSSDLTNFTYSLEVKGEAKISELIVDSNASFGNTLFIKNHQVGVGVISPTTKLDVSGGGVFVGKSVPVTTGPAIEAYSNSDNAIKGEATGTGTNYGTRGTNNSGYGVWGTSAAGYGVYGKSTTGSAVMVEMTSGTGQYGIYAENKNPDPTAWAGYFTGRVFSSNDVIGQRFLPEKLQASLVLFTQAQNMGTKTNYDLYDPWDIAFDGQYLWVLKRQYEGTISKVRPEDGVKLADCSVGNEPWRIIYAGGFLWTANATGHTVSKVDPSNCSKVDYVTWDAGTNCSRASGGDDNTYYQGCGPQALVYDGTYIWTANYYDPDYTNSTLGTSSISKIQASDGAFMGTYLIQDPLGVNPHSITFDGANIWTANIGIPGGRWWSAGPATSADSVSKFDPVTNTFSTYSIGAGTKPADIAFDGTNLWTANNGKRYYEANVSKINPADGSVIGNLQSFDDWPFRVIVDNITTGGPFIWVANFNSVSRLNLNGDYQFSSLTGSAVTGMTTSQTFTEGAFQYTYIWTTDAYSYQLSRVKSLDGTIAGYYILEGTEANDLAFDGAYIWTANPLNDSVSKTRVADGQKIADYLVDYWPVKILYDGNNIWVLHFNYTTTYLSKLRASDGTYLYEKELSMTDVSPKASPRGMIFENSSTSGPYLWILLDGYSLNNESQLIKYKISDNSETEYNLGLNTTSNPQKPQAMAFDGQYIWIANYYDDTGASSIWQIGLDGSINKKTDLPNGYKPSDILFDGKYLWTANSGAGSVSKWSINADGSITQVTGSPFAVNTNGETPLRLTFDGTYIWVATSPRTIAPDANKNYITILKASTGEKVKDFLYSSYVTPRRIIFDGTNIWLASNYQKGIYKFYSGSGYGQQAIEQVVRLQNIVPGYTDGEGSDFKHFNISGSGTVGADAVVGANVSVTNNVWGGSSDTEVTVSVGGTANCGGTQNCFNCPDGYFVKDIQSGASTSSFGSGGVITGDNTTSDPPGMAINASYMFVVGSDDSDAWRIEKRQLSDGALDTGFGTNGVVTDTSDSSSALDIALDSTYMYIIGYDNNFDWRIEKRQLSDGALDTGFGTNGVITVVAGYYGLGIAIDSNYMYLVGANDGNDWRIEKRQLSNGALDIGFGTNGVIIGPSITIDAHDITIDSTYMYVVGQEGVGNWRIEKRLLSNGSLDNSFGTNGVVSGASLSWYAANIAIDSAYMYVVGFDDNEDWRIEKRQLSDGVLDTGFGTNGVVTGASITAGNTDIAIAVDSSYMYVAGFDDNYNWRIEKRLLSNGSLDNSFGVSGVVTGAGLQGSYDGMAISIDSTYMYVSGNNNDNWRIEKRQLSNGVLDNLPSNAITKLLCRPL